MSQDHSFDIVSRIDWQEVSNAVHIALKEITNRFDFKHSRAEIVQEKDKLILNTSNHIHLINTEDIVRIEADASYSTFYTVDDRKIIVSRAIKEYEEQLVDQRFFRIHKSHLINISKVRYFDKAEGGYVIMEDGSTLPVASRKRDQLLDIFKSLT